MSRGLVVATAEKNEGCEAGEGVISEECEDRRREITTAMESNNTDSKISRQAHESWTNQKAVDKMMNLLQRRLLQYYRI